MEEDTARYSDIFAALGSESRLEIMRLLFAAHPDELNVGEIQAKLNIPNSTLSHHLEKLRAEGLVHTRRDKQWLWYSANAKTMEDLLAFLYTGRSSRSSVAESVKVTSEGEAMFGRFFGPIIARLFGSGSTFQSLLSQLPLKFTEKAIQAIELGQNESRRLQHAYVGTEQLLLGLIGENTDVAAQVLKSVGVTVETARLEVEKYIGRGKGTPRADIPFTPRAKQVFELSLEESHQLGHNYIGTEHLLLGLLRERGGLGVRVLENLRVDLQHLEQQLRGAIS